MKPRLLNLAVTAGLCFCIASVEVIANPITFMFTGTITQVAALDPSSPFPDPVDFGTPFSGTYTFDSTATNGISGDPSSGAYDSPAGTITLNLGGLTFSFTGLSIVTFDTSSFDFYGALHSENPTPDNPTGILLSISLQDPTGAALASNALPLVPPSLAAFDVTNSFFFTDTIDGNQVEVGGALDSLTAVTTVPEPAPLALVLLGAAMFALQRRRRTL